jgi:hypothetical protein
LKKSLLIDPAVQKQLRALPPRERADVVLKLLELGETFGQPHPGSAPVSGAGESVPLSRTSVSNLALRNAKSVSRYVSFSAFQFSNSTGIRKLRADLFECRVGLTLRVLFRASPDALIIRFIGIHDEVQRHLRGN